MGFLTDKSDTLELAGRTSRWLENLSTQLSNQTIVSSSHVLSWGSPANLFSLSLKSSEPPWCIFFQECRINLMADSKAQNISASPKSCILLQEPWQSPFPNDSEDFSLWSTTRSHIYFYGRLISHYSYCHIYYVDLYCVFVNHILIDVSMWKIIYLLVLYPSERLAGAKGSFPWTP